MRKSCCLKSPRRKMGIKSILAKPLAALAVMKINKWKKNSLAVQQRILAELIKQGSKTAFGKDHKFAGIISY